MTAVCRPTQEKQNWWIVWMRWQNRDENVSRFVWVHKCGINTEYSNEKWKEFPYFAHPLIASHSLRALYLIFHLLFVSLAVVVAVDSPFSVCCIDIARNHYYIMFVCKTTTYLCIPSTLNAFQMLWKWWRETTEWQRIDPTMSTSSVRVDRI